MVYLVSFDKDVVANALKNDYMVVPNTLKKLLMLHYMFL